MYEKMRSYIRSQNFKKLRAYMRNKKETTFHISPLGTQEPFVSKAYVRLQRLSRGIVPVQANLSLNE